MSSNPALLTAVADELAEIRAQVDDLSGLTSDLLPYCPAEQRGMALARIQAFDLVIQRLDGLSGLSAALGAGVPVETALHALTLSDQFERLRSDVSPDLSNPSAGKASGDLMLFD
jgi:hypothetical protein